MDSAKREEINNNLIGFWNEAIGLDENMRKELLMHIVPEEKETRRLFLLTK